MNHLVRLVYFLFPIKEMYIKNTITNEIIHTRCRIRLIGFNQYAFNYKGKWYIW